MDANIKLIMDSTGCTETEAQTVLDDAGGDVKKALKMLDAVETEILVFQIRFQPADKSEGAGFATVMADIASDHTLHTDMAYPLSAEQERVLDINMPPTVFASTIRNMRGKLSDRHGGASKSNAQQLKSKMSSNTIQTLKNLHGKKQVNDINERFSKTLSSIVGKPVTVNTRGNLHSISSLSSILGDKLENGKAKQAGGGEAPSGGASFGGPADPSDLPSASPQEELPQVVLVCEPEIDPFNGKPARELIEGEELIVKIKDGRPAARYYAELLGGYANDEIIPLCAPIVRVNETTETFIDAYVEFGPGVYGEFFIPPDVKVRRKDENVELYDPFQDDESLFSDNRMGRKILVQLGVLIVFVVTLIFVFLFKS